MECVCRVVGAWWGEGERVEEEWWIQVKVQRSSLLEERRRKEEEEEGEGGRGRGRGGGGEGGGERERGREGERERQSARQAGRMTRPICLKMSEAHVWSCHVSAAPRQRAAVSQVYLTLHWA